MKHPDFKPCLVCGKGMMHDSALTFFQVEITRMVVQVSAVQRAAGMEMMVGNPAIAYHMGPQEDLALPISQHTFLICEICALTGDSSIYGLVERAEEKTGSSKSG